MPINVSWNSSGEPRHSYYSPSQEKTQPNPREEEKSIHKEIEDDSVFVEGALKDAFSAPMGTRLNRKAENVKHKFEKLKPSHEQVQKVLISLAIFATIAFLGASLYFMRANLNDIISILPQELNMPVWKCYTILIGGIGGIIVSGIAIRAIRRHQANKAFGKKLAAEWNRQAIEPYCTEEYRFSNAGNNDNSRQLLEAAREDSRPSPLIVRKLVNERAERAKMLFLIATVAFAALAFVVLGLHLTNELHSVEAFLRQPLDMPLWKCLTVFGGAGAGIGLASVVAFHIIQASLSDKKSHIERLDTRPSSDEDLR